jgi:hypothetical protein
MAIERVIDNRRRVINVNKLFVIENNLHTKIFEELNKKYSISKEEYTIANPDVSLAIITQEDLTGDKLSDTKDLIKGISIKSHILSTEAMVAIMDYRPGKTDNILKSIVLPANIKVIYGKDELFKEIENNV